jgi:hypothetical protein
MSVLEGNDRFRRSRDRGCAYLVDRIRSDGSVGAGTRGVADYYKVPIALAVSGATAEANRVCDWIRRHGLTPEGDFGPRPAETVAYYYLYYNAWVILGAHRQGHFDLSRRGADFLLTFRDRESGGFYSSPTERSATTLQDLWVVSGAGQAMLYVGQIEAARGVGVWMARLMELQPNFPADLHAVYSRAGGLHTKFEPADEIRFVVHAAAETDQYFFHPGIAGGFLAQLYKATGERQWLDLAKNYMRQAESASDFLLRTLRAGKVGWAASVLYTLTGESRYRDLAIRVGDNIIAAQDSGGGWNPEAVHTMDVTAEMVAWLDEIHQAVGTDGKQA